MAVTNNFSASTLDLNGQVGLSQPTALVWGPDGRLYITEVDGDVKVLTVAFGDKNPADADPTAQFYVTDAVTVDLIKGAIQNHNDDGTENGGVNRQVTGIDVTAQYDASGALMTLPDGTPMVTMYVTSSDSRIGAGGTGNDSGLDTNSGVITMMTQTGPDSWTAIDIVRGLPRSEENHATNGLEVIQEFDANGLLVSERMIIASGGNANTGAPSNNFAGQEEQPLSAAILEVDLTMLKGMPVLNDDGRAYIYDLPTLNDPSRPDLADGTEANDPFGGNDSKNSAKLTEGGPVSIYSPGYRNAYDVEVTEDGRVWTYDNGANNSWGGRPIGEAGDNGNNIDIAQALGYIATNLNNGEGNSNDDINLVNWNPSNKDNFHEITRSDDLDGRTLSAGQGGAQTFEHDGQTYVYGGHPNPIRAEGSRAGLLFSPDAGTDNAYLLVSNQDSFGNGGGSDHAEVIAWLTEVENNNAAFPSSGIYGADTGDLTKKVLAVTPGVLYDIYSFTDGSGAAVVAGGTAPAGGTFLGKSGLPADIAEVVAYKNPIEGDYKEAGKTDGALDTGNGSINGLAEYTSTILDEGGTKMSGAILATVLGGGTIIVMGRNADGSMSSVVNGGFATAADRTTLNAGGGPLGITTVGDDYIDRGLTQPFQGSIWTAVYQQNGPLIEIFQPNNGAVPLAGSEIVNLTDRDLDGVDHVADPFEFSDENGYAIAPGETIVLDFNPSNTNFPTSLSSTGLLGAALDGSTPNRDAQTVFENFTGDQVLDGLYDIGGNVLPGGNAPILQIKKVIEGSVVGAANSARDVMQTGIRPSADTDRIVATMNVKNWIPAAGGVAPGQLTGMIFGDGTQANFLRIVFGSVNGVPGIEVGYEIGDANYATLAQVAVSGLSDVSIDTVDLRLTIDMENGFAVGAEYRLQGQADFTALNLNGFTLPAGVLQDVLTGDHTIGTGAAQQASGAAIGFLAETSAGNDLEAIDFNNLEIEAFGNEILADTAAEVGLPGSANTDTVIYTGTDTALAALAPNVENFDGTGSAADFVLTANDLDNLIRVGSGENTVTTGAGADSVRGTLADLDGDVITDFSTDDAVLIEGATLANLGTPVFGGAAGSATITLGGTTITLSGPDLADYDPADGGASINITQGADGVRITLEPALSPVIAISAGGADLLGATVRDQSVDFLSDAAGGGAAQFLTGVVSKSYTNATIAGTDIPDTDLDLIHQTERSAVDTGKWGYAIPVENGNYLVDLYFAEIYHGVATGNSSAGLRLFDIFVEDDTVETGLDVLTEAGGPAQELVKTYQATVTDGVLNIDFDASVDQAKLSGLVVWKVSGTFTPPPDSIAPEIVSIEVPNPPSVQDGERFAIVTLSDETGFDVADFTALDGSELVFTGIVPDAVSAPAVVLSDGGKTATLTYTLTRDDNSWPNGTGGVSVLADAYGDAAGNTTGAASAGFVLEANLASLVRGGLVRAINVGTTDPATATNLGPDLVEGGTDNNRYGGAIAADSLITDAGGNPIAFEADDAAYYTAPKTNGQLNANVDGQSGTTGSNSGDVDLDGSAYHTYRDSNADTWTATYSGFENGTYVVELHFAELFQTAPNTRVGDFHIQGQLVLDDFDVFAEAGGADKPISRTHNVTVTDGTITVTVDSSQGQAGYSAIAIYDAVPSDLPPTVSVGDVTVAEGADATLVFTRVGDLGEAVTVEYAVTPGSAGIDDYVAAATGQVTIPAGQGGVTLTIPTVDDEDEEGAESFTVTITGVSAGAEIGDGSATVTISPSDSVPQIPAVSISGAPTQVESGDGGTQTTLVFDLAYTGADATRTVDYTVNGVAGSAPVTFAAGAGTLPVLVENDDIDTGTTDIVVVLTAVSDGDAVDAVADTAIGTVTEDDSVPQVPAGGTIFELDFETAGAPLVEGGFDGALGGSGALDPAAPVSVSGGKLIVNTSDGDLSQSALTASKNDFVKAADLSDAALTEIHVTTRFDNPFTAAVLAANGVVDGVIPNYAQQGIVLATDGADAQDPDNFVKTIFGGNGGNSIQMWSQGAIDQIVQISAISGAAAAPFALADIAAVEMSLAIDRSAGTVAQIVTFFDALGGILGGVRPVTAPGFLTVPALALPVPVAAALDAGTTVVGVTSTDFSGAGNAATFASFEATWDFLSVTSPQKTTEGGDALVSITGTPSAVEAGDAGVTTLVFDLSGTPDATVDLTYSVGGVAQAPVQVTFDATGVATLPVDVANDDLANGEDSVQVALVSTSTPGFAVDATVATGTVTEDDFAPVAVADTPVTSQDTPLTFDPAANDTDADLAAGEILTVTAIDTIAATGGTVILNGDGTVTVTPDAGFAGEIAFGYTVEDSAGNEDATGSASVTVTAGDSDALVSIAAPAEVVEGGDAGATDLAFTLNADDGLTGDLEITLAVDGVQSVETVAFVNGAATFTVSVPQDSRWNGTESVTVAILAVGTAGYAPDPSAAAATGDVTEDDPADVFAGVTIGDFSDERLAPTDVGTLGLGESAITASQQGDAAPGGRDRDFITFTVAAGQALTHLYLDGYESSETSPQAFMGLQAGPAVTVDPVTGAPDAAEGLLAGIVYGPDPGADLLPILAAGDPADAQGADFPGFALPLAAGTYTLWLNQGGPSTTLNLRLVTDDAVPQVPEVSISGTPTEVESGDGGTQTTLVFDLAYTGADATRTVDYTVNGVAGSAPVTFAAGAGTLPVLVENDDIDTGTTDIVVVLTAVSDGDAVDAVADTAIGTVTEDDSVPQVPAGGTIFELDFETAGAPLVEGGFDGALGGSGALDPAAPVSVSGGKLIVNTSDGDLSQSALTASKNDFVKAADLSDAALTEIHVTTRFDNPFTAAVLAANGVVDGVIPNYAQQGIVLATDGADAQDPDNFVKTIFGGNGGNSIQMWSQGAIDQIVQISAISGAAAAPFALADIAAVEMSLAIDRSAGTVAQIVTFFDALGGILGGVRPVTAPGFLTVPALALPVPVAAALDAGTTVVGVTSTDFSGAGNAATFASFEATWDFLSVTSPQKTTEGGDALVSITGTPSAVEAGDAGVTTLVFDLSGTPDATVDLTYSVGGVAQAPVQVTFDATGVATLPVDVANDDLANGEDSVQVALVSTSTPGFAVDATVATGTVTEDDFAPVAVADTPVTSQDTPLTFDPAANDTDADLAAGEILTVTAIDTIAATGGTVILNGDGTVTVTPDAGFAGEIAFGYTVEDSAGNGAPGTATVTVSAPPITGEPIRIEAESGTLSGGFSVESGTRIRTSGTGEAAYDLSGVAAGDYLVRLGYWDENDGASSVGVTVSSASAGTFSETLTLDEATPSGTFSAQNYRETTLDGVFKLGADGLLTLTAVAQGSEIVRIDWIELIPTGAPADNAAPSVSLANVIAGIPEDADTVVRIKVADIVVTDDGQGVNTLGLADADAALFEIDGLELFLKAGAALDATANPSLDVTVTVDDATVGGSPDGTAPLSLPVTETGGTPSVSVGGSSSTTEGDPAAATLTLSETSDQPITVRLVLSSGLRSDPATIGAAADGGDLAFDATGLATLDVTIPTGVLSVDVPFSIFQDDLDEADFETFEIAITAANIGASIDGAAEQVAFAPAPAEGGILDDDAPVTMDDLAPDGDLDGDGTPNSADDDVDGDGIPNVDDPFAYDAGNGMTLAAGEERVFDFDIDGTIYQNGMTGFLQGTANGGAFDEDTGAATVSGGFLTVDPVTSGDTGGANNPQDDAQVGVKNGAFTAKALVVNPWFGAAPNPNSFDQLGLAIGLDSDDMIKLVFGQSAGVVEFQKQETTGSTTTATKYGGSGPNANVPLPAGVTLDTFAKAEIFLEVVSTGPTSATVTGSMNFLDAAGAVIATGSYGAAPIGGALAAALADPATGVGVGFTHVDGGGDPGFIAQLDSLSITAAGAPAEDLDPPTATITLTNPVDATAPLLVNVALDDASGIDPTTLGDGDLALSVGGVAVAADVTYLGFAAGVATYEIAASPAGWLDGQQIEVTLVAGEVADLATTPNTNANVSQGLTLDIGEPVDPGNALEAFAAQDDLDIGQTYGADVGGGAVLRIMKDVNSVASSNFGSNSFQVENIGGKKISAIFIDAGSALYPDSVFDPDGLGGDAAFKSWAVNTDGIGTSATGAYVSGTGYFLPGVDPIPNSGGSGGPSNGGYKGAMVKFDASSSGGFQNGEIVGFSGDMDPNSIAGMAKSNASGVDTGAIQNWDVGGISGHELIGSLFTVLFDDGTTASGQLASDKSNAGSVAIASQSLSPSAVTLTVNGVGPGATGVYGGVTPSVIVTGDTGDLVRITLSKGLNPVTNDTNGIADLVRERLDRYDFKVNNAFDEQSVDVVIGSDGTFDASDLFDYGDAIGTGKGGFTGDDVAPIAFVASVIAPIGAGEFAPAGPVTAPIYLTNQGGPVTGDPVDPPEGGIDPAAPVITGIVDTAIVENGETFAFDVDATDANPGDTLTYGITGGADAGLFEIDGGTGVVSFKDPASFTPGGDNVYDLEVTVSDPGGLTDTRAYAVTVTDDVPPTTLNIPIAASADDWEQRGGAGSLDLEFGLNGTPQTVGLRFDGVTVPDGAVLQDAFIRFTALETLSGNANLIVGIENTENAAGYTSANAPQNRATVDDFVWNPEAWTAGQSYTLDVEDLVSGVIGSDGIEDGALSFIFRPGADPGSRIAEPFDGDGQEPELVLVFQDETILG